MAEDDDPLGADVGLDPQINLSPASGLDPSRLARTVSSAVTSIYPQSTTVPLTLPVSTTEMPRGAEMAALAAEPGQPVNLLPPNPVNLVRPPQVAPVIPAGSIAPQVQTAQMQGGPITPGGPQGPVPLQPQMQGGQSVSPYQANPAPSGVQAIPGTGQGLYGSNRTMYPAVNPNMNPLEVQRGILKAEADRALNRSNDPWNQIWMGESSKKWAAEAAEKYGKIDQIDKQLQEQKNNQMKADNAGIPRNQQTWSQNNDTIVENLVQRMRSGDQSAMDALLGGGHKDLVAAYQPDMIAAMTNNFQEGLKIKNQLDSATTDREYNSIRNQLQKNADAVGFNIPNSLAAWQKQAPQRDEARRRALLAIAQNQQRIAATGDFTDQLDPKMAEVQKKNMTMSNGTDEMPGTTAKVHLGLGVNGVADVRGSNDLRLYGADKNKEGSYNSFGTTEQKKVQEKLEADYPKTEREKAINLGRAITMATTDPKTGKPMPVKDGINTNPSVRQVLIEGITAAARGGAGGTNGQLIKLELAKQGPVQRGLDDLITAWAGGRGVLTGKEGEYLSKLTQGQMRYVIEFLQKYNNQDVSNRLKGFATQVGSYGGHLEDTGLEKELQDNPTLKMARDYGRDREILYRSSLPAIVREHDRIYVDRGAAGRAIPGVSVNPIPLSALPGLTPELYPERYGIPPVAPSAAPVAPISGGGPPPPAVPPATPPGGGGVVTAPYNPRMGRYGGPAPVTSVSAPTVPAGGAFPTTGAAPVPFTPAPAMTAPGPVPGPRSSLSDTIGNVASNMLGISSAQATERPPAPWDVVKRPVAPVAVAQPSGPLNVLQQATAAAPAPTVVASAALPSSWGAGVGNVPAPALVQRAVPTPQQPGGPGTGGPPPAPVSAPPGVRPGGTFSNGVPSNGFPAHVSDHVNAREIYGTAGQTAQNVSNNPVIATNSAIVTTSSAHSESSFHPDTLHDKDKDGNYIGYGLFGHNDNGGRLSALQQFAGVPVTGKPDQKIPANVQTSFFVREMSKLADADPFVAKVLSDPNATAEDLTRVQIRLERPRGYTGPGTEEKASRWDQRLANTRAAMTGNGAGSTALAVPAPAVMPYPNPRTREEALANYQAGVRQTTQEAATRQQVLNERAAQATRSAANIAPAAMSAAGGVLGSAAGPVGTAAGSVGGGALGGMVKQYFAPSEQSSYGTEAGWGAAQGVVGAIPGAGPVGMAARTAIGGLVPAARTYMETGDAGAAMDAGALGAAGGALGEAFGRGLGMVGHQLWGGYTTVAKKELMDAAKVLAEQEPKIVSAAGKMIDNPAYVKAAERAKQLGQDPEALAYAHNTAVKGVASGQVIPPTKGEALVQRPGAVEAAKAGAGLEEVKQTIAAAGGTAVPTAIPAGARLKDGPVASILTPANPQGTLPVKYLPEAQHAELAITKPAATWGEKWGQLAGARTDLLKLERSALLSTASDKLERATAMRTIADSVRTQQEKIANKLLPPDQANALVQHLTNMDARYRRALEAGGPDIVKTIAGGGEEGRVAKAAFRALVGNDVAAERMLNALVKLHAREAKVGGGKLTAASAAYAISHIPGVGPLAATGIGMAKGWEMLKDLMLRRGSGQTVKFTDLVRREVSKRAQLTRGRIGAVLGSAAAAPVANWVSSSGNEQ